jgi:hypothetical protein
MSGTSTLDPDNFPVLNDRVVGTGHGTGALGPSDTSDSGSDVRGGPGLAQQVDSGLDRGANDDLEESTAGGTAGPDVGDANLDSDTDSGGTGERAAGGRDAVLADGNDIGVDHIETIGLTDDKLDGDEFDVDEFDEVGSVKDVAELDSVDDAGGLDNIDDLDEDDEADTGGA